MEINIRSLQSHILTRVNGRPDVHEDNNFEIERYHREFLEKTRGLKRELDLEATWCYVVKNGPRIDDVPERVKSNVRAVAVRQEGNRYFGMRVLDEAAEKYNESICWAEPGSEELGIGFANRSAICYEHGDYEICLVNIMLARKNNCPDRLEPKLAAREHNCRLQLAAGKSHNTVPCPRFTMNVEVDPKIPFMANGLRMTEVPEYGRAMVAERSFRPGDVLMKEKAFMTMSDPQYQFLHCGYCAESKLFSLIPCPDCASVMYCSEKCLREDKRTVHRFECGIKEKLNSLYTSIVDLGPKMFFYGLTLFGDNVEEMQRCCEAQERSGSNPMDVDYSNGYNALEVFKNLNQVKVSPKQPFYQNRFKFCAAFFYTVYMQSPAVRALITTEAQQTFMVRCFLAYMQIALQANLFFWDSANAPLLPIASIINHSCDPNVYAVPRLNHFKMIALKPIAKGEQIFFSYGPVWYKNGDKAKQDNTMSLFTFQCDCVACNPVRLRKWLKTQKPLDDQAKQHLRTCNQVLMDDRAPLAAKMNTVQQFIKRYAYTHPNETFCSVLQGFTDILYEALMEEWVIRMRAEGLAEFDAWKEQQQQNYTGNASLPDGAGQDRGDILPELPLQLLLLTIVNEDDCLPDFSLNVQIALANVNLSGLDRYPHDVGEGIEYFKFVEGEAVTKAMIYVYGRNLVARLKRVVFVVPGTIPVRVIDHPEGFTKSRCVVDYPFNGLMWMTEPWPDLGSGTLRLERRTYRSVEVVSVLTYPYAGSTVSIGLSGLSKCTRYDAFYASSSVTWKRRARLGTAGVSGARAATDTAQKLFVEAILLSVRGRAPTGQGARLSVFPARAGGCGPAE